MQMCEKTIEKCMKAEGLSFRKKRAISPAAVSKYQTLSKACSFPLYQKAPRGRPQTGPL
jgi:hypothetical protein